MLFNAVLDLNNYMQLVLFILADTQYLSIGPKKSMPRHYDYGIWQHFSLFWV